MNNNTNNVPNNSVNKNIQSQEVKPIKNKLDQNAIKEKFDNKNKKPKKDPKAKSFKFTVMNDMGKKESGTLDIETESEARNFLVSQGYQVLDLKLRTALDIDITFSGFNANDLSFTLTQLSTYIKSGIPLADSVKILAKQSTNPAHKKVFNQLVYELLRGENLSAAMAKQSKYFPSLLINMVKTSELTGDLPSILDEMADYYTSMAQTKKQMISAMTYPAVVLLIALGVLVFMLTYLVPQFTSMFESNNATLPLITQLIMAASDFLKKNWIILILIIGGVLLTFYLLYNNVKSFKKAVQTILMHLPIVSKVIIYNEIANFTRTFASLINHGVFITDSMEILSKITNNEIYKEIINNTLTNLAKGDPVSAAFKGQWAVPVVAYEMIVTGESTGRLGDMMEKVSLHFQSLHKSIIDQMKSLIEPLMICILAAIVGVILLSIIQPMFSIYDQVK